MSKDAKPRLPSPLRGWQIAWRVEVPRRVPGGLTCECQWVLGHRAPWEKKEGVGHSLWRDQLCLGGRERWEQQLDPDRWSALTLPLPFAFPTGHMWLWLLRSCFSSARSAPLPLRPSWSCDFPSCFCWTLDLDRQSSLHVWRAVRHWLLSQLDRSPLTLVGQGSTSVLHVIPALGSDAEVMATVEGRAPARSLALSLGRRQMGSLSSLTVQRPLKRLSKAKALSASLTRWTEVPAPPGGLSPAPRAWTPVASTVLLVWSCSLHSVLLSVWSRLFYVFEIGPSFHSLMWLSFSRLCIRVLLQSDPEKGQFPEVVWLIAHSNFPPCWLLGAQSSGFFFTHCAFSIFANLF